MKKILALLVVLISFNSFSQKIEGEIANYKNRKVNIIGFDGVYDKQLYSGKTDSDGKFIYNEKDYKGAVRMMLDSHEGIIFVVNGEDVSFVYDSKNVNNEVKFLKGSDSKFLLEYSKEKTLLDNKIKAIEFQKQIYTDKDSFFKSILEEESRLSKNKKSLEELSIKNKDSFAKYYMDLQEKLSDVKTTRDDLVNILSNDGQNLESTGLMKNVIIKYIQSGREVHGTKFNKSIVIDIEQTLKKLNVETLRGQFVASFLMDLMRSFKNDEAVKKITEMISCLKCEMDDSLRRKVKAYSNFKIGGDAPEIIFNNSIKGISKMSEIKSKYKLILFWASWCPHCRKEIEVIKGEYNYLKSKGVEIIAVSADTDKDDYNAAIKTHPWKYFFIDYKKWNNATLLDYGVSSTPTMVLVDKDNKIIGKYKKLKNVLSNLK